MSIIFNRFSQALNYNALLYFLTKSSAVFLNFFLWHRLSSQEFSLWANTLAITFLTLLWIDFGLRKSLPRFIPLVVHSRDLLISFSLRIFLFQLSLILLATPFFYLYLHRSLLSSTSVSPSIYFLAPTIFLSEGIFATLRLFFHSLFLNKPLSLLSSTILILETSLLSLAALFAPTSLLLVSILSIKSLSSILLVCVAGTYLYRFYRDYSVVAHSEPRQDNPTTPVATSTLSWHAITKHSLIMWISTLIKSLSERNFLIPLLTHSLGTEPANIFKVAQDGALWFERTAIKTIGTADTSLLAYVHAQEEGKQGESGMSNAFQKLMHNITALCIPLFGILIFVYLRGVSVLEMFNIKLDTKYGFQIFIIFTATYLLEVLVSPYERVLEVKQRYSLLFAGYLPYMVLIPFILMRVTTMGLINFVLCMQGVRLVSACCLVWLAWREYRLPFPWQMIMGRLGMVGSVVAGLYGVIEYGGQVIHMFFP